MSLPISGVQPSPSPGVSDEKFQRTTPHSTQCVHCVLILIRRYSFHCCAFLITSSVKAIHILSSRSLDCKEIGICVFRSLHLGNANSKEGRNDDCGIFQVPGKLYAVLPTDTPEKAVCYSVLKLSMN